MAITQPITHPPATLTWRGIVVGARELAPVALFVIPFGVAFGAAAAEKGLSAALSIAMSGAVFAGASQFAALELWVAPLPFATVVLAVLAANARHILLGASLAPWLLQVPRARRFIVLAFLSDTNWAHAVEARSRGASDAGLLLGGGLIIWVAWVIGTAIGTFAGAATEDLSRPGLDLVMVTFFAATLLGQWRGSDDFLPWAVAGGTALVASWILPQGWHIIIGALCGASIGALRHGR